MEKSSKRKFGNFGTKVVSMVAAFSIALCGVPSIALAADTSDYDYTGSYSATLTADGEDVTSDSATITSTSSNSNAVLAENGGTATVTNATITKSGSSSNSDNCNFYGVNSIVLAVGESSMIYISDSVLSATSEGSNGIFATDSATVYSNSNTISTTSDNSRGLDATYAGTIVANDTNITTQGDHSAGVATDRGGGYVSLTNSEISTEGDGSPILYSTGDIEVDNVTGTASGSQIAGMEGLNTIMIANSDLTSTNTGRSGSDPVANGVIIYQSTSGDADTSTGETALFQAVDSTLSSSITSGSMFYLTNTTANIVLDNTTLDFDSDSADLLMAVGNDSNNWGSAGSNGATVNFTGIGETLSGNIVADTISSVDVYLTDATTWTGAASIETNSSATTTVTDNLSVNVDSTSTWVVTDDSTVYNLNVASGGSVVDESGNTVKVVNSSGTTLVSGTSSVTVTVKGSYSTTVSTSSANEVQDANIDRTAFDNYYGTSTEFGTNTSSDSDDSVWTRLYGSDRYGTMSAILDATYEDGSASTIVLASGENYPDALAATALSGLLNAPLVITETDELSDTVSDEIEALASDSGANVIIVGGTAAVSESVANAVDALDGISIERVSGSTRYLTADAVYNYGTDTGWGDTAIVVSGDNYPDALSASAYAYAADAPIFLAEDGELSDTEVQAIQEGGFTQVLILGGSAAVDSDSVEDAIGDDVTYTVINGTDRYETSSKFATWVTGGTVSGVSTTPEVTLSCANLTVASGKNFPDALTSANLTGAKGSPLLLVADGSSYATAFVKTNASSITSGYIIGGKAAVSSSIEKTLESLV
ncbi:MAG: cell wall-binding repeat-containing protein [Coriobacteriales bacterium]|jgi:putative cell wall-binding protein